MRRTEKCDLDQFTAKSPRGAKLAKIVIRKRTTEINYGAWKILGVLGEPWRLGG
jgi:hypothetical protein